MKKLILLILLTQLVQVHAEQKTWNGSDGNWFNPSNWTPNGVPMAADSVTIGSGSEATIDPTLSSTNIVIAALNIGDGGLLNTLPRTVIDIIGAVNLDNGSINAQDSQINIDQLVIPTAPIGGFGFGSGGVRLNPTTIDMREILALNSSYRFNFGLGGNNPAAIGNIGTGFYATLRAEDITLDGILELELRHGFEPNVGDRYRIIEASNSFSGQFEGLDDGDIISSLGVMPMRINYDAMGVTLTAVILPQVVHVFSKWGLFVLIAIVLLLAKGLLSKCLIDKINKAKS